MFVRVGVFVVVWVNEGVWLGVQDGVNVGEFVLVMVRVTVWVGE